MILIGVKLKTLKDGRLNMDVQSQSVTHTICVFLKEWVKIYKLSL